MNYKNKSKAIKKDTVMLNVRKILFYSILTFSALSSPYSYAGKDWGEAAGTEIGKGLKEGIEKGLAALGEQLPPAGAEIGKEIGDGILKGLAEAGKNHGAELGKGLAAVGDKLAIVGGAYVCVDGVYKIVQMGSSLYVYTHPDDEKKIVLKLQVKELIYEQKGKSSERA